jgi:shikimate dehydrogenase
LVAALEAGVGPVVADAHAVVLGTGGAARAVVEALVAHDVASVVVHGRNEERAEALASAYPNVFASSLVYRPVDLVVNTIPAAGRGAEAAVLQGVHHETVAVDIAYEPRLTPWRALYEASGCRTMNGLAMLAYQAALQMNWWWGVALEGAQLLDALP